MQKPKNPNIEIRNSKQYQITKIQMTKKKMFWKFKNWNFEFVSDFALRISNLVWRSCLDLTSALEALAQITPNAGARQAIGKAVR